MLAGRLRAGGVVSLTVTVKLPVALPPVLFVAVQLTVVAPSGNVEPEAGVQLAEIVPCTGSVAVTVKVTTAPEELVASALMFPGRLRVGRPDTVTVKLPVALFPALSVAVQVTVVVPSGKVEPEAGVQLTGTVPSTASVADAE